MRLLVAFAAVSLLNACALPLDATIVEPVIKGGSSPVYNASGEPIPTLTGTFQISGKLTEQRDDMVLGYKCTGDSWRDDLIASPLKIGEDGRYHFRFAIRRSGSFDLDDYDLVNSPFDICIYLERSAYPLRRESNRTRVPANEISRAIMETH